MYDLKRVYVVWPKKQLKNRYVIVICRNNNTLYKV